MDNKHLAVAAAAAALAGAVSGAAIDKTPLQRGADAWDQLPRYEIGESDFAALEARRDTPDHYPIVTPQGRFEVAELRDRGLYRNRRFGMQWTSDWPEYPEPAYEVAAADYEYLPPEPAPRRPVLAPASASETASERAPAILAANAEPLAGEAAPAIEVRPRTIDVAATLASR